MKEADIQGACCDLLALDGWRRVRTDLPHLRGLGVQEKGIADDLFIRYWAEHVGRTPQTHDQRVNCLHLASGNELMWIEWKRIDSRGLRTKASREQIAWHTLERKRGALTLIAGQDFEPTIDGFRRFYAESGLCRRKICNLEGII